MSGWNEKKSSPHKGPEQAAVVLTGSGVDLDDFDDNGSEVLFDFSKLKLVDKPDSPKNARTLPQTLYGCEGYMERLPLKPPNVDQKIARTVQDMVNILTHPDAAAEFDRAEAETGAASSPRRPGTPSEVYDYAGSDLMKKQLKMASRRTCHARAPGSLGHIVNPGCISFYKMDGKTFAVTEGRWLLMSYKASWIAKNISLDQDQIAVGDKSQVLIIRVPPGSVGRIRDQGVEILLDEGTHVFNSGRVRDVGTVAYATSTDIIHGRYNYLRVPRGKYARVWAEIKGSDGIKSVQPRLLQEGEHFIDSHLFKFDGLSNVSDEYIKHGAVHQVSVTKGKVAKVMHDNFPRLLGEGDHTIESPQFTFMGMQSITNSECISHGTITILRVVRGKIALAWKDNEPTFLDRPGLYEYDSPDFSFVEFRDAEEQLIQLGAKKIVLVHTGQVGVTYDQGRLKIMPNGRHIIESASHIFHRFLSTQQMSIRLTTFAAGERMARSKKKAEVHQKTKGQRGNGDEDAFLADFSKIHPDSDLTICETKDLVKVGLRADVFYSIEDPERCIKKIDPDTLEDLVRETAVATLTNIIRSTSLNQIAQSKSVSFGSTVGSSGAIEIMQPPSSTDDREGGEPQQKDPNQPASTAPPPMSSAVFFDRVHDEFLSQLHDDFMLRYGVDIHNIRIESFKIMNEELADQISRHALTTAQIENQMANLEGQSMISTTEERTAAEVENIKAEALAASEKTTAVAANERRVDAAKADAESNKIIVRGKAEAEAEAILLKAKAEAEAIRLKAAAEADRADLLSRTTLGQQEALLTQYSHMVVESNRGVEKVVYMDPSVNRESPFALGSLNTLNYDLHSLSQLGIAAGSAVANPAATAAGNGGRQNGGKKT